MTRRQRFILFVAVWAGFGLLLLIGGRVKAGEGYTCADVRAALATVRAGSGVSEKRAVEILEAMAKGGGARPEQIARAKRCLK